MFGGSVMRRSEKLEELFVQELGSALLSSVSKPRLDIILPLLSVYVIYS